MKTHTLIPTSTYLRLCATLDPCSAPSAIFASQETLRTVIDSALETTHGTLGAAALAYDVLHIDAATSSAILRAPVAVKSDLWAALTLITSFRGAPARITVTHASNFLLALTRS